MDVITLFPSLVVLMDRSDGALKLSGETAFATASAYLTLQNSNVISASNILASQLFSNKFIDKFYEGASVLYGNLCSRSYIVSPAFS